MQPTVKQFKDFCEATLLLCVAFGLWLIQIFSLFIFLSITSYRLGKICAYYLYRNPKKSTKTLPPPPTDSNPEPKPLPLLPSATPELNDSHVPETNPNSETISNHQTISDTTPPASQPNPTLNSSYESLKLSQLRTLCKEMGYNSSRWSKRQCLACLQSKQ